MPTTIIANSGTFLPGRLYFISTPFYNRIKTFQTDKELFYILKKYKLKACAHDCFYLKNIAHLPENTEIVEDKTMQVFMTNIFSVDYPLLPRIRKIYKKLHEGGIILNLYEKYKRQKIKKNEIVSDVSPDELTYVFYFQAFGLLFAIILFLLEVVINKFFKYW